MIDPKLLRQDPVAVCKAAKRHNVDIDIKQFESLESQRKTLQEHTQTLQAKRNTLAKQIGSAKVNDRSQALAPAKNENVDTLLKQAAELSEVVKKNEIALNEIQTALLDFQSSIPNVLHDSVPTGKSENDNVEIRKWGTPKKFDFTPKDHVDLGARDHLMDF